MNFRVRSGPTGILPRLIPTVFLLLFAAGLTLLHGFLDRQADEAPDPRTWAPVDAQVESAGVENISPPASEEKPMRFAPRVRYRYEWTGPDGKSSRHVSDQLATADAEDDDYTDAWLKIRAFQPGGTVTAHVNPADPAQAVLDPSPSSLRLVRWIPLVLLVIPLAILRSIWRAPRPGAARTGSFPGVLFFSIFLLAGVGSAFALGSKFIPYLLAGVQWVETPCTVLESRLVHSVSTDSDGTSHTYRPEIYYEYEVNGQAYRSNRYGLLQVSSSGREAKREIVNRHPAGSKTVCHVNPEKPWEAKLQKSVGWSALFLLFPIPFLLVGGIGLWACLFRRPKNSGFEPVAPDEMEAEPDAGEAPAEIEEIQPGDLEPVTLKPRPSRVGACVGVGVAALIWNGMVWGFIFMMLQERERPTAPLLFMSLFALVGLFLAVGFFSTFLKLFNAAITLELPRGRVRPGEGLQFAWRTHRGMLAAMPTRLRVRLLGEIRTVTGTGKRRRTQVEKVHESELANTDVPMEIEQGQASGRMPADRNPKIEWKIVVDAEVPGWPDIADTFPLRTR